MSDEGEKTCPLCAEEMDLTDQQLKPCKCGYEICVWCWHQIMDLAEKSESEGRCPACRTPYDKDKIVGMAANCERLVAEINMEKKHKSQKAKTKTSESRKQLTSVRVIQRNLVYIVGLPLDLADEDVLQRKEYFGQYGKVLKVSISRTSAGTIQQFANSTCSVYITYSKEEEAFCCIQSVHGFVLDGRPLRACFGTTKYCHAWLRNAPCTNPDCLYLHEIGSQEDSFLKDEYVSSYARVQQITGITNNLQRRSGNVLPVPEEDQCNNTSAVTAKPIVKNSSNTSTSCVRGSPPNSSSGRAGALPPAASWGARASNCNSPIVSLSSSNGPTKQKAETIHGTPVLVTTGSGAVPINPSDGGKKQINEETYARHSKSKAEDPDTMKHHSGINSQRIVSEMSFVLTSATAGKSTSQSSCAPETTSDVQDNEMLSNTHIINGRPCSPFEDEGSSSKLDGKSQELCSETSSITIDKLPNSEQHSEVGSNDLTLNSLSLLTNQGLQWQESDKLQEYLSSTAASSKSTTGCDSFAAPKEASDLRSDSRSSAMETFTSETEDDFNSQRLRDAIVVHQTAIPTSSPLHLLSHLRVPLQRHTDADCAANYAINPPTVNRIADEGLTTDVSSSSNGYVDHFGSRPLDQDISLLSKGGQGNMGRFNGMLSKFDSQPALDVGENSIISNILSLDLDSWDDSLTSPQNLAKLLRETDKQDGSIKLAGSWKAQNSNQSRFSFARQEDSRNQLFDIEASHGNISQVIKPPSFSQDFIGNRDPYLERIDSGFGFPHRNIESSDNMISGHFPSSKLSVSRSQISAPPGFSAPSRPPPPGFTSHERSDQPFDVLKSGSHFVEMPSFLQNPYQASQSGSLGSTNDIEFFDPAILAVGEGRLPGGFNNSSLDMRPNFPVQSSAFENNSRIQALMQRSLSSHQSLRYTDVRDNFSPSNDAYGFTSRHMESQSSNHGPFSQFSLQRNGVVSNGSWDGWNELPVANDVGIADLLRSDRLGINKFYGGYEDAKFRMTNPGDLYNRSFGM